MERQTVTVGQFFKEHGESLEMKLLSGEGGLERVIREPTVNRPGLALSGFTRYFAYKRMQVMGHAEVFYLRSLRQEERVARFAYLFAYKIPCVVFSRSLKPDKEFLAAAAEAGVPVFQSPLVTMKFINKATLELEMMFAPRTSEHGCMVDILGVGVIIKGESGIGKSEAVLALIERGYSLVADDVVKAVLVDGREVLCTSSELTRDHMEVRGIGIINVAQMFGVKAIRKDKNLDAALGHSLAWFAPESKGYYFCLPKQTGCGYPARVTHQVFSQASLAVVGYDSGYAALVYLISRICFPGEKAEMEKQFPLRPQYPYLPQGRQAHFPGRCCIQRHQGQSVHQSLPGRLLPPLLLWRERISDFQYLGCLYFSLRCRYTPGPVF